MQERYLGVCSSLCYELDAIVQVTDEHILFM